MLIKNNTASLQQLLEAVNNLPNVGSGGIELPILTNPASEDEIFLDKEVIDENGKVKTGTFTIDNEINIQEDLLSELRAALNGKAGGSGEQVEWSANEDAIISGNISTYVNNRVKNIGSYVFNSCANLTSVNFPVCTTIENGAFQDCSRLTTISFPACTTIGSDAFSNCRNLTTALFPICTTINDAAFSRCYSLTTVSFPACTTIGKSAFCNCSNLTSVNFPVCTTINYETFTGCRGLTSVNLPVCISIANGAFEYCSSLATINIPKCTTIDGYAFYNCVYLKTISLPACTTIASRFNFYDCSRLISIYLTGSTLCKLVNSQAFASSPFAGNSAYALGTPHIYVPASLIDAYKSATNWTYFSSYITAIPSQSGYIGQ